jgi:dihydroorotate dehydrogenase electron transfer subunit
MHQTEVTITHKELIGPAWWRLTAAAPEELGLHPGQFLFVRCAGVYLRRPIFPAQAVGEQFTFLARPAPDPGLAWLTARMPGDRLDLLGPLGRGFPHPAAGRNLLLAGDGPAIGPLLAQMEAGLAAGAAVTLALGGSRASALYPVGQLPPAVELQAATLDGALGHHGPLTDLLPELLRWADLVCAVGSSALYQALKRQAAEFRPTLAGFLYGLPTPPPMACGVGVCLSCRVGPKLACSDGPVFDLAVWDGADL